jgi:hypothetical protein
MYQQLSLQDPSKFTQIGNFGLKMYHLATLPAKPAETLKRDLFIVSDVAGNGIS